MALRELADFRIKLKGSSGSRLRVSRLLPSIGPKLINPFVNWQTVKSRLLPFSLIVETPWQSSPTLASTLSLLYLGVIATGLAWLIRFRILTVNGLVFQTQVAYLIPIFGIIFGYFLMDEVITWKVLASLVVILIGIYIFKKNNKG